MPSRNSAKTSGQRGTLLPASTKFSIVFCAPPFWSQPPLPPATRSTAQQKGAWAFDSGGSQGRVSDPVLKVSARRNSQPTHKHLRHNTEVTLTRTQAWQQLRLASASPYERADASRLWASYSQCVDAATTTSVIYSFANTAKHIYVCRRKKQ